MRAISCYKTNSKFRADNARNNNPFPERLTPASRTNSNLLVDRTNPNRCTERVVVNNLKSDKDRYLGTLNISDSRRSLIQNKLTEITHKLINSSNSSQLKESNRKSPYEIVLTENTVRDSSTIPNFNIIFISLGELRSVLEKLPKEFHNWDTIAFYIAHEISHKLYNIDNESLRRVDRDSALARNYKEYFCDRMALGLMDAAGFNVAFASIPSFTKHDTEDAWDSGILGSHPSNHNRNLVLSKLINDNYWANYAEESRHAFNSEELKQIKTPSDFEKFFSRDKQESLEASLLRAIYIYDQDISTVPVRKGEKLVNNAFYSKDMMDSFCNSIKNSNTSEFAKKFLLHAFGTAVPKTAVYEDCRPLEFSDNSWLDKVATSGSLSLLVEMLETMPNFNFLGGEVIKFVDKNRTMDFVNRFQDSFHHQVRSLLVPGELNPIRDLEALVKLAGLMNDKFMRGSFNLRLLKPLNNSTQLISAMESLITKDDEQALSLLMDMNDTNINYLIQESKLVKNFYLENILKLILSGFDSGHYKTSLVAHYSVDELLDFAEVNYNSEKPDQDIEILEYMVKRENLDPINKSRLRTFLAKVQIDVQSLIENKGEAESQPVNRFRKLAKIYARFLENTQANLSFEDLLDVSRLSPYMTQIKNFRSMTEEQVYKLCDEISIVNMDDSLKMYVLNNLYQVRSIPSVTSLKESFYEKLNYPRPHNANQQRSLFVPASLMSLDMDDKFFNTAIALSQNDFESQLILINKHINDFKTNSSFDLKAFSALYREVNDSNYGWPIMYRKYMSKAEYKNFFMEGISARDYLCLVFFDHLKNQVPKLNPEASLFWLEANLPAKSEFRDHLLSSRFDQATINNLSFENKLRLISLYKNGDRSELVKKTAFDESLRVQTIAKTVSFVNNYYQASPERDTRLEEICEKQGSIVFKDFMRDLAPAYSFNNESYYLKNSQIRSYISPILSSKYADDKKSDFFLWLIGLRPKPKFLDEFETESNTDAGFLRYAYKNSRAALREMNNLLFLGNNGLLTAKNKPALETIINESLAKICKPEPGDDEKTTKMKQFIPVFVLEVISNTDYYRKQRIVNEMFEYFTNDKAKLSLENLMSVVLQAYGSAGVKFGQVLSNIDAINEEFPELVKAFEKLKEECSSIMFHDACSAIKMNPKLRNADPVLLKNIGSASIKDVFSLSLNMGGQRLNKVLKVRRPQANKFLDLQRKNLSQLVQALGKSLKQIYNLDCIPDFSERIFTALKEEVDFSTEISNREKLANILAKESDLEFEFSIPKIYSEYCDANTIVEDLAEGQSFEFIQKNKLLPEADISRIKARVKALFMNMAIKHGFYHADMHRANYFVSKNPVTGKYKITLIDAGLCGTTNERMVKLITAIQGESVAKDKAGRISSLIASAKNKWNNLGLAKDLLAELKLPQSHNNINFLKSLMAELKGGVKGLSPLAVINKLDQIKGYTMPEPLYRLMLAVSKV